MSWLVSLIVVGAVLTSGTGIPDGDLQNAVYRTGNASPVVLDETETFSKTYPFDSKGKIKVSNINGKIDIESWDRNEIKLEYVKVADTKEKLKRLDVQIDAQQSFFKVKTHYEKRKYKEKWKKGSKLYVDYRLTVPRTARLDSIGSVNGAVTVKNMTNYCNISAVNGRVTATNLRGTADLSTVNGVVSADFDSLDSSSSISLETVNGRVQLYIPSNSNATLKAGTLNGSIKNDFRLPVRKGKYVGRDLYGRIGSGGVKIKLSSVNGGLAIYRKDDGKSLSPATNLLNTKSNDKDDSDEIELDVVTSERLSKSERAKMTADVKRAMAEARKTRVLSEKELEKINKTAMKDAEKALKELEVVRLDKKKLEKVLKEVEKNRMEALENLSTAMFYDRSPYVEEKTQTFEVKGTPTVDIDAQDCDVIVKGWDKKKVKYSVSRVNKNRGASPVYITSTHDEKISIKVKAKSTSGISKRSERIRVEVFVPKKSNLEIHTHHELRLEGVSGEITLKSENGAVDIRDVGGSLNLEASNKYRKSRVRIVGFDGELTANLINTDVYLEGDFNDISAEGRGSRVFLTLDEDTNAMIETDSLRFRGEYKNGSNVDIAGINLVKEDDNLWRVGEGDAKFSFDLIDSEVLIRSQNSIHGR